MDYKINSEQQEMLDSIFSGLLPHDKCNPELVPEVISELKKFIFSKDLYGAYYVMWTLINNLEVIKLYRSGYTTSLKEDVFDRALQVNLESLIKRKNFDADLFFRDYGKVFNLSIPEDKKSALDFVYTAIMDKYQEWYEMATPTEESLANIPVLLQDMQQAMAVAANSLMAQILLNGIVYKDKKYQGYFDWLSFGIMMHNELQTRFSKGEMSKRHSFNGIDNYEDAIKYDADNSKEIKTLWYMGFEPIDNRFPISTHDIVTIVADEGTGKTRFVVDQAYRALMAGNNVVIVCGETDNYKIKKFIEARHIWEIYNRQFTLAELNNTDRIMEPDPDKKEELLTMIRAATIDLYDNPKYGKLNLLQALMYERAEEQLREEHNRFPFDVVFIDHVAAMDSTGGYVNGERLGTMQEKITHLYKVEDVLTKELNVCFVNTSHTNNDTAAAIKRGKETGVRIGGQSAATTKYASIVMLITQPQEFKQQDQIILEFKKTRDYETITFPVLISRNSSNCHMYYEELQYLVKGESVDNSELEALY